jgi:hypothetical protein
LTKKRLKKGAISLVFHRKCSITYLGLKKMSDGVYAELSIEPETKGSLSIVGPEAKREYDVKSGQKNFKIFELNMTPAGGPYYFNFSTKRDSCATRVNFGGGNLILKDRELIQEMHASGEINYKVLSGIDMRVLNNGDLPVYLNSCTADIDSKSLKNDFSPIFFMPEEEKNLRLSFDGRQGRRVRVSFLNEKNREALLFTEILTQ